MKSSKILGINNTTNSYCLTIKRTKQALENLDEIFDLHDYLPIKKDDLFIKDKVYFIFSKKYVYIILPKTKKHEAKKKKIFELFKIGGR